MDNLIIGIKTHYVKNICIAHVGTLHARKTSAYTDQKAGCSLILKVGYILTRCCGITAFSLDCIIRCPYQLSSTELYSFVRCFV